MPIYQVPISRKIRGKGFTLVELLIVIMLISILLTFSSVSWNSVSKTGTDALLEHFSIAVSLLREEAISNYEERVIQFDLTTGRIAVGVMDQQSGFAEGDEIQLPDGYRLKDIVINGEASATGKRYATFRSSGMVDRTVVHFEGEKQHYSLMMDPLTAKVTGENGYVEETPIRDRNNAS
jgi:prepilin-type N-terminal cleavage/methylation domain-containing protein